MIKDQCKHEWTQFKHATADIPAKYECTKCKNWLTASDVFQLEALNHLKSWQTWLPIIAIIISLVALFAQLYEKF